MVFSDVTRKQAFMTHLAASASIFAIISYLIVFHWFPDFYFYLDGGNRGIITIFFVDVILGPGLTLLVFKPGKKSLKFDMAVILLLQLTALSWGVTSVYEARPGGAVFYWGALTCIAQEDVINMDMDAITAGPSGRQRLSFLQRPDTLDDFYYFQNEAYSKGSASIYYYAEKIVPLGKVVEKRLKNYKLNLSKLAAENEAVARTVESYINNHGADMQYINLVPLSCRYGSAIAVYDMREQKITDFFEVDKIELRADAQDEPLPHKHLQDDSENKS